MAGFGRFPRGAGRGATFYFTVPTGRTETSNNEAELCIQAQANPLRRTMFLCEALSRANLACSQGKCFISKKLPKDVCPMIENGLVLAQLGREP
jgi:hypothetical protein